MPLYLVIKTCRPARQPRLALVVTYLTFTLPFTIWLLKSYFQGIPRELEEAALVDGCSWLADGGARCCCRRRRRGWSPPAMFAFMTAWNDYLFAVILTSSASPPRPLPVVVAGFATDVTTERTLMAAGGVLAVIPPLRAGLPVPAADRAGTDESAR